MPLGRLAGPLLRVLGGAGGALYGAATAEDEDDALLRSLGYGALGGVVGPAAVNAARRGLSDFTYFSFLSSPDTIAKGSFGAIGGAINAAIEQGLHGLSTMGTKAGRDEIKSSTKIIGNLLSPGKEGGMQTYFRAILASPDEFKRMHSEIFGHDKLPGIEQHLRGKGIGTLFAAPDMAAVRAMVKGGFSPEEAARYTLTGQPQTKAGQELLQWQRKWRTKPGDEWSTWKDFLATQAAPFMRVGLLGLEKGAQRIPGVGFGAHRAMKTGATTGQKLIHQGMGTGAGVAGYFGEDHIDPRIMTVLGPLAGPAYLPFQFGRQLRHQAERGRSPMGRGLFGAIGPTFSESSPFGFQPFGLAANPTTEIPRRLVPAAIADVAKFMDPAHERVGGVEELTRMKERGQWGGTPGLAQFTRRLPGVRQSLPEAFAPVDVFGRPRYETPRALVGEEGSPLAKGLSHIAFPGLRSFEPPAMPQSDPLMAELRGLGLHLQAPASRVTLPGTGLPLQHTAQSAAATQRVGGIPPQIAAQIVTQIMSQPGFQAMPQAQRNYIARMLMDRIRGRLSSAMGAAKLATALSRGAQMPALFGQL